MEPIQVLVVHPERGPVVVEAYCRIDAQLQAAAIWDVPLEEVTERCRIGLKTEQLEQLRKENGERVEGKI
nr:MAG TPA: hypothetical protein [Bacteriophage sp.]